MTVPEALTVLHIDTERGWRGGQRQVHWLATLMRQRGHRPLVAARPDEPLAERLTSAGVETVPLSPVAEFDPIAVTRLRRIVRGEHVAVIHAHTGHAVALAALAAARLVPMVLTRRVAAPLRRNPGTRWKYARASAIIAVSRAVADALVLGGIGRSRITIIPSGVDLGRPATPASGDVMRSIGIPAGAPWVVQVGALAPEKAPVTFVRAVAVARRSVPNLHAVLVGDGPSRSRVEAEIGSLGLGEAVHLTGQRADADALLAAATVAALSSEQEGLGTVLLDAMAFGRPIAATRAGGIPEIVEDERSGLLVATGDHEALGEAIARLVRDPGLAERLAEGARRRVREFSVERTADRTIEVYRQVVGAVRR